MKPMFALSLLLLSTLAWGQAKETCKLQTYASSWMVTGTPFSVKCPSGVYNGTLVTTPARRFFRRGHLRFKFSQPVAAVSKNPGAEGKFEAGRGRQIVTMLMTGGTGIGTKDLTDGLSGAVYKSWYAIPISCVALAFFSNGGDINLKPGFELHVVQLGGGPSPSRLPAESFR
jgi:hypothetical protein